MFFFFFFKQKTAYEMRISDWSSDVCSSDLEETVEFDMLHAVPPQVAPQFVADSQLANADTGFVDIDKFTLQHVRYPNVFGVGDAGSTPNAKTMAAARKLAPILAVNPLAELGATQARKCTRLNSSH